MPTELYECSTHKVRLVLEILELSPRGYQLSGIRKVEFFRCPATDELTGKRCMYCKPNKWQKYEVPGRGPLPPNNQNQNKKRFKKSLTRNVLGLYLK